MNVKANPRLEMEIPILKVMFLGRSYVLIFAGMDKVGLCANVKGYLPPNKGLMTKKKNTRATSNAIFYVHPDILDPFAIAISMFQRRSR